MPSEHPWGAPAPGTPERSEPDPPFGWPSGATSQAASTSTPTDAPEVTRAAEPFATPHRLHPASILLGVNLRQALQAILVPFIATLSARAVVSFVILGVVGLVGLGFRFLAWQRFRFSFDGEMLRVDEGVVSRSHRHLDVDRIQQVEVERSPLARVLGLAALRVETAGSSAEVEVELKVIPLADAEALRDAVRASKAAEAQRPSDGGDEEAPADVGADSAPEERELLRVPLRRVLLAGVTGVQLLVFPAVIGAGLQFAGEAFGNRIDRLVSWGVQRGADDLVDEVTPLLIAVTVLVVLLLSLATAAVVAVLADANFRMHRVDEDVHVRRGLLSTRHSVVPLRRIQMVELQRNPVRRLLGYTAVRVHSAGGSAGGGRQVGIPLLPEADVDRILAELLPGVPTVPALRSHPTAARRRAIWRWVRPAAVPLIAVWVGAGLWSWAPLEAARLPMLALIPVAIALGVVEHRHLAHALTDRVLASRHGALSLTTQLSPLVKVQAVSRSSNPFQRRLGLATLQAHVAGPGGDVTVLDPGADVAADLQRELTARSAYPVVVDPDAARGPTTEPETAVPSATGPTRDQPYRPSA